MRTVRRTAPVIVWAVVLGALAVPVARADSALLADLEISRVAPTRTGGLTVTGSYVCPSGNAPRSTYDALAAAFQQLPGGGLDGSRFFGLRVSCDGTENGVAVRIPGPSTGEAFRPDLPLIVSLSLYASNSEEDSVSAYDRETATIQTLVADITIRDVGFVEIGVVRVTGTYVCPDGYGVESTFALVSQLLGPGTLKIRHFDRRLVCDGTWNEVAVKFRETRAGEPFVPGVGNSVQLSFGATSEDGEGFVQAIDQRTLIIHE